MEKQKKPMQLKFFHEKKVKVTWPTKRQLKKMIKENDPKKIFSFLEKVQISFIKKMTEETKEAFWKIICQEDKYISELILMEKSDVIPKSFYSQENLRSFFARNSKRKNVLTHFIFVQSDKQENFALFLVHIKNAFIFCGLDKSVWKKIDELSWKYDLNTGRPSRALSDIFKNNTGEGVSDRWPFQPDYSGDY